MKVKGTLMVAALAGAALAVAALAHHQTPEHLGKLVSGPAERVVEFDATTTLIKAGHLETLAIQNSKGQRFVWRFDTLHAPTGFPLKSIAPPEFDAGDTWVYVGPPKPNPH